VAAHGRGRWPEVVGGSGGCRGPTNWPKKLHMHNNHETGHGLFRVCGGLLQWFWWLPMVGEVLGVLGDGSWRQWLAGKVARITENLSKNLRGVGRESRSSSLWMGFLGEIFKALLA